MSRRESEELQIRTRVVRSFGMDMPMTASILMSSLMSRSRHLPMLSFAVGALPPTINHMYTQVGHRRVLSVEAQNFRQLVTVAIGAKRFNWKPVGLVAPLIFMASPHWITKKHTLRDMDGDNRVKPLFDAIQATTGVRDCTNWEHHCWKLASAKIQTIVYLFDLGDIVEWYP